MGVPQGPRGLALRPVRILSVPPSPPITIRFLGPYLGLTTHWHAKRSYPCLGADRCPPAVHRGRTIWKAYAPVDQWELVAELWIPAVLEITESLEHLLTGRRLRGEVWMLSRKDGESHAPIQGLYSETLVEEQLREPFSILPVLERFYHSNNLIVGVPNPVPPQMLLEPHQGASPRLVDELVAPGPEELPVPQEVKDAFRKRLRDFKRVGSSADQVGQKDQASNGQTNGQKGGK